jgi:hypothetical protein
MDTFKKKKYREGIKKAFRETILPGYKPHSELREILEVAHELAPAPKESKEHDPSRNYCPLGCGESWKSKYAKGLTKHSKEDGRETVLQY